MNKWLIVGDGVKRGVWLPRAIELSQEAEADIVLAYNLAARKAEAEISGFGKVVERDDHSFLISDIVIPPQECTGGHTFELSKEMQKLYEDLRAQGIDPSTEYIFWWHSHVDGEAWFSSIDDRNIKEHLYVMMTSAHFRFLERGESVPDETFAGPFISLVGNIQGEMTARCDFLHRVGEEYSEHMDVIPIIRSLSHRPEEEREAFLRSRVEKIQDVIRERVTFGRSIPRILSRRRIMAEDDKDNDDE